MGGISELHVDWSRLDRKLRMQRLFQRLFDTGTNKRIKSIVFASAGQSQQVGNCFLYRTPALETAEDKQTKMAELVF